MNRKKLESYQPNKRLIDRLQRKIEDEKIKDIPVVVGKVKGSSSDFPYIEQRFSVMMDDPAQTEKRKQRLKTWEAEIERAEKEILEVEVFISGIEDARDREIFTYRYIDGIMSKFVADKVGYTKGRVSQIISKYVKD